MVKKSSEDREALRDKTSREDKADRRLQLFCSYCRPHKGENKTYRPRGTKKPKKKQVLRSTVRGQTRLR